LDALDSLATTRPRALVELKRIRLFLRRLVYACAFLLVHAHYTFVILEVVNAYAFFVSAAV